MPIGKKCKVCDKILIEHTRAGEYVGKFYYLGYCSEECKANWQVLQRIKKKKRGTHNYQIKKLEPQLMEKFNSCCYFCNSTNNLQKHHIIPFKDGGTSELNNFCLACSDCHAILSDGSSPKLNKWIEGEYPPKLNPEFIQTRKKMFEKLKLLDENLVIKEEYCFGCNRYHTKISRKE